MKKTYKINFVYGGDKVVLEKSIEDLELEALITEGDEQVVELVGEKEVLTSWLDEHKVEYSEDDLEVVEEAVKASGEDSETMEPVAKKAPKRPADNAAKTDKDPKSGETKDDQVEDAEDSVKGKNKRPADNAPVKEEIDFSSLFEGEEFSELSEEFKTKASTMFEVALSEAIKAKEEVLEEDNAKAIAEHLEDFEDRFQEYMTYAVETWMAKNEVVLANNLRVENAESFLQGLHTLFTEHYVHVDEEAAELSDVLAEKIAELEEENKLLKKDNFELDKMLESKIATEIVDEVSAGLSETQKEKLAELAEGVSFEDMDKFKAKVTVIRENYFKEEVSSKGDSLEDQLNEANADVGSSILNESEEDPLANLDPQMKGQMNAILNAIKQSTISGRAV